VFPRERCKVATKSEDGRLVCTDSLTSYYLAMDSQPVRSQQRLVDVERPCLP
jgi:hypothetical protein